MRHVMVDPASGSAATLHPGDLLVIHLPECADSDRLWSVVAVPTNLEPRGDRTTTVAMSEATTVKVFRFEAAGPGAGVLRLALTRSGQGETGQVRQLCISVVRG